MALLKTFIRSLVADPNRICAEDLEYEWIKVKSDLMATCPYKQEVTYRQVYSRAEQIISTIAKRHWHLVLDGECQGPFYRYVSSKLAPQISISPSLHYANETLQGLSLLSHVGGMTQTLSEPVSTNPSLVMSAIDYLIEERNCPMGLFLKGFVMKYGIQLFLPPNPMAARRYLTEARDRGVGSAVIELQFIGMHERALSNANTVHSDPNGYQDWVTNSQPSL